MDPLSSVIAFPNRARGWMRGVCEQRLETALKCSPLLDTQTMQKERREQQAIF